MHLLRNWSRLKFLALLAVFPLTDCPCDSAVRLSYEIRPAAPAEIVPQAEADAKKKQIVLPAVGDVLIVGGASSLAATEATAEFYNPATRKFTKTGSMHEARVGAIGTELETPLGKVLVAGGLSGGVTLKKTTLTIHAAAADIELYEPATGTFTSAGNLATPRTGYTQTMLANGKVLIAGGITTGGVPIASAEIFDPSTATASPTGNMTTPRMLHTVSLLEDGSVLIAGGVTDSAGDTTNTAELYNPSTGLFKPTTGQIVTTAHSPSPMAAHTATLIEGCGCSSDGKVLLVDGFNSLGVDTANQFATLYDPSTETFTQTTGQPIDDRTFQTATLLPDGDVLIAGGFYGQSRIGGGTAFGIYGGARSSAEIFDPSANTFSCINGKS